MMLIVGIFGGRRKLFLKKYFQQHTIEPVRKSKGLYYLTGLCESGAWYGDAWGARIRRMAQ